MKSLYQKIKFSQGMLLPLIALASLFFFFTALSNLDGGMNDEGQKQLEQAVRRGAVSCYANEGTYPDSLEYLEEHYGILVDEEKYAVHYEVFADNLMPEITVVKK